MKKLYLSASAVALISCAGAPAFAQSNDGSDDTEIDGNVIVVTGSVRQNQESIDEKRDVNVIGDFLVADEIGRQPDFNIADAFRRAPGVTTVFDEDEGQAVGIRGLSPTFTVTKINGVTVATSQVDRRQTNLEVIPSSSVSQLNVFKSRNAASEGNAIGGTIELGVVSAFDRNAPSFVGSFAIGGNDNQDVPGVGLGRDSDNGLSFRADGTFTSTFWDDMVGLTLSGSYLRRRRDQQRDIPLNEFILDDIPVPGRFLYFNYPNTIERWGGTANLEFRPSDNFDVGLLVSRFEQNDHELRYGEFIDIRGATITNNGNGTFAFDGAASNVIYNQFFIEKPTLTVAGTANWRPAEDHLLTIQVSNSTASNIEPNISSGFAGGFNTDLAGTFTASTETNIPVLTVPNTQAALDGSDRFFTGSGSSLRISDDEVTEYGFDYSYNTKDGAYGFGLDAGVQFRTNERDLDQTRTNASLAPGAAPLSLDNFVLTSFANAFQNQPSLFIDQEALIRFQDENPGLFVFTQNNLAGDYNFEEDVTAVYGQVVYRGERFYVDAGLRYEDTSTTVIRQVDGAFQSASNSYDNFLPSVNASYDISENVRLRAAYYRALGRPDPIDLAGSATNGVNAGGIATLSTGNVDLQARTADNFDVSLEYYFPDGQGLLSAAVFYKDISNDIFRFTDQETIGGVLTEVNTPRNAGQSDLKGIELAFIWNSFDFLPAPFDGFGINTNFTYIDGSIDVTDAGGTVLRTVNLIQQPETIFNAALFYQNGPFETRVAYNRTGDIQDSISQSADGTGDRINRAQERLDWSARYDLSDNFQLTAEVRNVTNETSGIFVTAPGGQGSILRDQSLFGRTFFAGVAVNF